MQRSFSIWRVKDRAALRAAAALFARMASISSVMIGSVLAPAVFFIERYT